MAAAPLECSVDMGLFLDGEFTDIMAAYLIKCHTHELTAILDDENTSTSRHHSVAVDCLSLLEFHLILGTLALHHPLRLQPLLDTGVREAQQQVLDALKEKDPFNPERDVPFVGEVLGRLRKEVAASGATVLGFVGLPFTIGTYLIEGQTGTTSG